MIIYNGYSEDFAPDITAPFEVTGISQFRRCWSWDIAQRCVFYPDCGLFLYIGEVLMRFIPCRVTRVRAFANSYEFYGYMQDVRNVPKDIKMGITARTEEQLAVLSFAEDTREAVRRFKDAVPKAVGDKVLLYGLYVEEVRLKGDQENGENDAFIEFGNLLNSIIFNEKINGSADEYKELEKLCLEKASQYEWDVVEILEDGKLVRVVRGDTSLYRTIDTVRGKKEIIETQIQLADMLMKVQKESSAPGERRKL